MLHDALNRGLAGLNIATRPEQIDQFVSFIELIDRWNKAYNLTAIKTPQDMVARHILDSASIHPYLQGARFADIGSGAGLPGIPLAVLKPDCHFTLVDSRAKKVRFMRQAVSELSLTNVDVHHSRVEQFIELPQFDGILSRAFSSLAKMVAATQHLCAPQGCFYAMKGCHPEKELRELAKEYIVQHNLALHVPLQEGERHLVIIQQTDNRHK